MVLAAVAVVGEQAQYIFESWTTPAAFSALIAALAAFGAYIRSRKGQATAASEQRAANQLRSDAQQFEQQERLIASHVAEIERVNKARVAEQERHDIEMDRLHRALDGVTRQRDNYHRHILAQTETIQLLRSMVTREVNQAAAEAALALGVPPEIAAEPVLEDDLTEQSRQDGYDRTRDMARED